MIGHLLRQTVTVWRPTSTTDEVGGQTVTRAAVGTIRVKVSQPLAAERVAADQYGARLTHVVHALAGADVRRGDELVGSIPSATGEERLRVLAVIADSNSTYRRLECEVDQAEGAA